MSKKIIIYLAVIAHVINIVMFGVYRKSWRAVPLMYSFHRSRLSYDLEILYDCGLDLTDRGQYQTRFIFFTTSKIHLVGELILHLIAGHPRSPYIWSFIACGDPRWPAVALYT